MKDIRSCVATITCELGERSPRGIFCIGVGFPLLDTTFGRMFADCSCRPSGCALPDWMRSGQCGMRKRDCPTLMEAESCVKHDQEFSSLLVRAEVILGVHASMHGSSGEQLGCGTTGFERSDVLVLPVFSTDYQWAEQHKSLFLKHCGTVRYETGTDMRADSSTPRRTTQGQALSCRRCY